MRAAWILVLALAACEDGYERDAARDVGGVDLGARDEAVDRDADRERDAGVMEREYEERGLDRPPEDRLHMRVQDGDDKVVRGDERVPEPRMHRRGDAGEEPLYEIDPTVGSGVPGGAGDENTANWVNFEPADAGLGEREERPER